MSIITNLFYLKQFLKNLCKDQQKKKEKNTYKIIIIIIKIKYSALKMKEF